VLRGEGMYQVAPLNAHSGIYSTIGLTSLSAARRNSLLGNKQPIKDRGSMLGII